MALSTKYETVNNFKTTLTNAPGTGGVTFSFASLTGLSAGMAAGTTDFFITVVTASTLNTSSESLEIVLVTAFSGNDATVTRAQHGTTAQDLAVGDTLIMRPIEYHTNAFSDALLIGTGVLDDDSMATATATTLATSESIKAYVDAAEIGLMDYKGAYDASSAGPGTASTGDTYTVTVGGTGGGFWTPTLEIGDMIIAESDIASGTESDWTVIQGNLTGADVALNTTHRTSNGSDHSFIDQDVTIASTPTFGSVTSPGVITGLTVEATGDTSAGDNAAMGYTATEGLVLTGQGSTNDVTIKNDAGADVISIPTGTTNTTLAGAIVVDSGTTDGATTTNKLIQSGQNFLTTVSVGDRVYNTTDNTITVVTAVDSNTQLSLRDNIMATGEVFSIEATESGTLDVRGASTFGSDILPTSTRAGTIGTTAVPFGDAHVKDLYIKPSNAGNQPTRHHRVYGQISGTTASNYLIIGIQDGTPTEQAVARFSGDKSTILYGDLDLPAGDLDVSGSYFVDSVQVVTNQQTGWSAWTGTATRSAIATGTATATQCAEAIKALTDDLRSHGLID